MILTGETEVLGEKHYTASVVDKRMSMEHWWNDGERGNLKYWDKNSPIATLSTRNFIWIGLKMISRSSHSQCSF